MGGASEAPVVIADYDPAWPPMFDAERAVLQPVLQEWLVAPIEHIGSTAVAGLAAKPVIDIMAPVESLDASRDAIEALRGLQYLYAPYRSDVMHWFCKPDPAFRTHHLHLVPYRSALWNGRIAFREALRHDARLAHEYAELKRSLAAAYRADREAYTQAKAPFIEKVLDRMRARLA